MKKYLFFFLTLFLSGYLYADVQPTNLPNQMLTPVNKEVTPNLESKAKAVGDNSQSDETLRLIEERIQQDAAPKVITDYEVKEDAVGMTRDLQPMSDVLATLGTSATRNLAPQRKTSFTFPEAGLFLIAKDYSVTGSTLISPISITSDGTNYTISDVYGLSSVTGFIAPTITIDAAAGTVSIAAQEVLNSTTYGHLWMVPVTITATGYSYTKDPITGTIDDKGNITLGTWGIVIPLDTDINPGRIYNVFTSSDWKVCNMSYVSTLKDDSTIEGVGLIEQSSDDEIVFYNLGGNNYGDVLYATIYPNKTAKMSPQKVYSNIYGSFYTYNTDSSYKIHTDLPIDITATDTGLLVDYWALACRGATYTVARNFQKTVITTDFAITWPAEKTVSFEGEGTSANPYKIKTTDDMAVLAQVINNGQAPYNTAYYQLENDLDFTGVKYTVIGSSTAVFSGTFDGQNHTISNVTITGRGFNVTGLFGETSDGSAIKNLNVKNIYITNDGKYTGCVVGNNYSIISNVNVQGKLVSTGQISGGIAAQSYARIENCSFNGYVSSYGATGGMVGYDFGPILKCSVEGSVVANSVIETSYRYIGGIVGMCINSVYSLEEAHISDCYVSGQVTDNYGYSYTGGIAGGLSGTTLERCFNTAAISAFLLSSSTDIPTGGVVGWSNSAVIQNCYNAGTIVKSGTSEYVGGIVGYTNVMYSSTSGQPTVMKNLSTIKNCYNSAQVISSEEIGSKGIYGSTFYKDGFDPIGESISNCFTDSQMSGYTSDYDMTTVAFTSGQLPEGFDSSVWEAKAGYYPTLKGLNDNAAAQLSASALIPSDLETLLKVKKSMTVSTQGDVVWKLYDNGSFATETSALSLSGNTISVKDQYSTSIVAALQSSSSSYFKMYRVAVVPKVFEGDGTEESPYLLRNVADFKQLNEAVSTYTQPHAGDYFRVTNDIDFADSDFIGIGAKYTPAASFGGVIDGENHYIHNLKVAAVAYDSDGLAVTTGSYAYSGLFNGLLASGVIKNLNIASDCSFSHWSYAGNLVGWNEGRIENCRNYASATAISSYVGGIAGYSKGVITGCYNGANITVGISFAGGLVGGSIGTIELSENAGDITGAVVNAYNTDGAQNSVGGIAGGIATGCVIDRCINNGNVTAYSQVAGITGYAYGGNITNTLSTGLVSELKENTYRGAVIGNLVTIGTVENNYYDSSIILYQAANSAGLSGITGLNTTAFTSGSILAGLNADDWDFTAGAYPSLKKFSEESLSKLKRSIYLGFGENESLANVTKDVELSADSRITWKLDSSSTEVGDGEEQPTVYFSVSDGKLHVTAPTGMQVGTDGLTATLEGESKYFPLQTVPVIFDGAGTEANPYQIKSVLDLHNLAEFIYNTGYNYANTYFKVMNDIDYAQADSTTLNPIAKGGTVEFSGIFDGNGKTIKGFTYENTVITNTAAKPHPMGYPGRYLGLFGKVGSLGVIKNLTVDGQIKLYSHVGGIVGDLYGKVENCTVKSKLESSNAGYIGGIASKLFSGGVIDNCIFEGEINTTKTYNAGIAYIVNEGAEIKNCTNKGTITGTTYTGGIVQDCRGVVRNCVNSADAVFNCTSYLGGIACTLYTTGEIYDCVNYKDLTTTSTSAGYYGGIVAQGTTKAVGAIVKNCTNYGAITAKSYNGGIIGRALKGDTIEDCVNYGTVTNTAANYCGGIVGYTEAASEEYPTLIKGCTNYGVINGYTSYTGGVISTIATGVTVEDCANFGNVNLQDGGTSMLAVGGVSGSCSGTMTRCFNYGTLDVICHGAGGVSGIISSGTIDQCFNAGNVTTTLTKYSSTSPNGAVGGIAGYSVTKATITNSCNFGDLTSPQNVAGLLARAGGTSYSTVIENCYNAGKINITGELEDPISANLYVRNSGVTVEWENIYYDSDVNTGTYAYDPSGRGRSTADLMEVELGESYVQNRATLPILSAFADNEYACLPAIRVLFTKEGDTANSVNDSFYVGMPCEDLVYTTSENLRMSTSNPGLVYPLSIGEGWIKVATSDGKYSRQFDVIVNSTSAVSELDGKTVVDTIYYDLQGSRVYNPAPGAICIVKTVYDDGTSYTNKQVVR